MAYISCVGDEKRVITGVAGKSGGRVRFFSVLIDHGVINFDIWQNGCFRGIVEGISKIIFFFAKIILPSFSSQKIHEIMIFICGKIGQS